MADYPSSDPNVVPTGLSPKALLQDIRDIFRLIFGLLAFGKSGITPPYAFMSMIRLHCRTNGRSNDALSWLISKVRPPEKFVAIEGVLGRIDEKSLSNIDDELRDKGYYVFPQRLDPKICDRLLNFALRSPVVFQTPGQKPGAAKRVGLIDRENPQAIRCEYEMADVLDNADVQDLIADSTLLKVAETYLGSAPVLDIATMWWNTAKSKKPDPTAAQFYHFDMDRPRWLKYFIYLTDVGPENGPHRFVRGSHRTGALPKDILSRGYSRLDDKLIDKYYSKEDQILFTGPRGMILAEDTRGIHKGQHVLTGDRLILQFEFCNTLFGAAYQNVRFRNFKSPAFRARYADEPRIYSMFSVADESKKT